MSNGPLSAASAKRLREWKRANGPELVRIIRKAFAATNNHRDYGGPALTIGEQRVLDAWMQPRLDGLVDRLVESAAIRRRDERADRVVRAPLKAVDLKTRSTDG